MIKVELNYNPYILKTSVKFNGQKPRINSLVEKFQEGSLQRWVRSIPDIFYDEMNGYNFELEFSGTKRDFLEVENAFRGKGVSDDLVHIFHKNELDGRYEKVRLIEELIDWLERNKNRNFDFDLIKETYADLFNSSYVYIIFQGNQLSTHTIDDETVSVEHVSSIDELDDTELRNTPILIYLSKENSQNFQKSLVYFLKRDDVEEFQIFFLIHPELDRSKVERVIMDLGIEEPMIVSEVFDVAIKKYLEIYPVSEHIYSFVALFRYLTNELSKNLEAESEKCAIVNREIHLRIDQKEEILKKLKRGYLKFVNRDNIEIPAEWYMLENEFLNSISCWRKRKTKITDDNEAGCIAEEFESDVKKSFEKFLQEIVEATNSVKREIDVEYRSWYQNIEFDENFQVSVSDFKTPGFYDGIFFADELKKIYEEEYVQPKEDILGLFFKTPSDTPRDPVLQRTYYYQNWRDYVTSVARIKKKEIVQALFECIETYEQELAKSYIEHIENLIEEQTRLKDQESEKLSDEERLLQNDIDWLVNVQDQLKVIERG